jgi:hypothetical protein
VVSRQSGYKVRTAGLERVARLAGEAFGHEEITLHSGSRQASRFALIFGAAAALVAFLVLSLR